MTKPFRYQHAKWEDVPLPLQEALKVSRETRRGIYIHGTVGTGKTHIAWAMYEYAREQMKLRAQFWNTTELLADIREDFDRNQYDKKHREEQLMEFRGILFLDDIGAEKMTDWVQEQFYRIVNRRYEEALPTIFTSNLPIRELGERLGDRTASRIVEMCDLYPLNGADRRLDIARQRKHG